ncbi:hypothetical protein LguiB_018663 [Lonicera macranthoides]
MLACVILSMMLVLTYERSNHMMFRIYWTNNRWRWVLPQAEEKPEEGDGFRRTVAVGRLGEDRLRVRYREVKVGERRTVVMGEKRAAAERVSSYNELVELQLENHQKLVKMPTTNFILKSSSISDLIDSKSESAIDRVKYHFSSTYFIEEFGFVRSCLFHGLDPYQEMIHSISSREVMVRSSRGLTEPGTFD